MNGWEYMQKRAESISRRALVLAQGQSPYYNLAPLMQLIEDADALGFKIVPKTLAEQQEDAFTNTADGGQK